METFQKKEISTLLRRILTMDTCLTNTFVISVEKFLPLKQFEVYYKLLEISCHGLIWLLTTFILIWFLNNKKLYQMQMNFTIGLLIDALFVTALKVITRRRRPTSNDNVTFLGPDRYSFPSGHASRAVFIVYFFFYLWPISFIYALFLLIWSFFICISRLLMRRHHILDVVIGIFLGIFEGLLMNYYIYLKQGTCINLISWVID